MSPRKTEPDQTPQQPDPGHGNSPTRMGMFGILATIFAAVIAGGAGYSFLTVDDQPNFMAWIFFAIAAVMLFDAIRRIRRIATGRDRY